MSIERVHVDQREARDETGDVATNRKKGNTLMSFTISSPGEKMPCRFRFASHFRFDII